MSVKIKTPHEIELMREAGRILALVHENLAPYNKRIQLRQCRLHFPICRLQTMYMSLI